MFESKTLKISIATIIKDPEMLRLGLAPCLSQSASQPASQPASRAVIQSVNNFSIYLENN